MIQIRQCTHTRFGFLIRMRKSIRTAVRLFQSDMDMQSDNRYNRCDLASGGCDNGYRGCFANCGGEVDKQKERGIKNKLVVTVPEYINHDAGLWVVGVIPGISERLLVGLFLASIRPVRFVPEPAATVSVASAAGRQ